MRDLKQDILLWLENYKEGIVDVNAVLWHLPFVFEEHGYIKKDEIIKKICRETAEKCAEIYAEEQDKAEGYQIDRVREAIIAVADTLYAT